MNQIPSIEEAANTEVEKLYETIDDYYRENFDESQARKKMYITELLHQELQKARHDWLRGEIVKLDGMRIKESHIGICGLYTAQVQMEVNEALQTIIDRYQAELDQDKK